MIFHSIYTMTIGTYMRMIKSGDDKLMLRHALPVPEKILQKQKRKLIISFNESINSDEVSRICEDNVHKQSMMIRINLIIPSLYHALKIDYVLNGLKITDDKQLISDYTKITGRKLTNIDDIEYLLKLQKQLVKKYKQMYNRDSDEKEVDIVLFIHELDSRLKHPVNRESKLYELAGYINQLNIQ